MHTWGQRKKNDFRLGFLFRFYDIVIYDIKVLEDFGEFNTRDNSSAWSTIKLDLGEIFFRIRKTFFLSANQPC